MSSSSSSSSSLSKARTGEGDSNNNNNNNNNKRAPIPTTTTNSDNKKQKVVVHTSATATSIFSSTTANASTIVTAKATATDNIDELKSENTRLQELVATLENSLATKEGELATKEVECQRLRDANKLSLGPEAEIAYEDEMRYEREGEQYAAEEKKRKDEAEARRANETVIRRQRVVNDQQLKGIGASSPATTVENTFVSSSAVADVMVEEGIHDGILTKIFDYVVTSGRHSTEEDAPDDETIIPNKTQDDVINLMLLSKRFHNIISTYEENGKRKWNIIPLLVISPPPPSSGRISSVRGFLHKFRDYIQIENKQEYGHIIVKDIHKIKIDINSLDVHETMERNITLDGIRSLHIVPPPQRIGDTNNNHNMEYFIACILTMVPNLLEIDLSIFNEMRIDKAFKYIPVRSVERIRWNNIPRCTFNLSGKLFHSFHNLRRIFMDDSIFDSIQNGRNVFAHFEEEDDPMVINNGNDDDDNNNDIRFIFHGCCKNLERVSIRNAKYTIFHLDDDGVVGRIEHPITQNALIKFARNVPQTLTWFRSDLSHDNIRMLQIERPTIEFLN